MLSALNKLKRQKTAILIYEGPTPSGWKAGEIAIAGNSSCLHHCPGFGTG
jgi:hypothetical protein